MLDSCGVIESFAARNYQNFPICFSVAFFLLFLLPAQINPEEDKENERTEIVSDSPCERSENRTTEMSVETRNRKRKEEEPKKDAPQVKRKRKDKKVPQETQLHEVSIREKTSQENNPAETSQVTKQKQKVTGERDVQFKTAASSLHNLTRRAFYQRQERENFLCRNADSRR